MLPLAAFIVLLIGVSLFRKASDAVAMVLLIPLAVAASGAPDRLPRGVARFVDWFGLVFSARRGCAMVFTGRRPSLAHLRHHRGALVARQAPVSRLGVLDHFRLPFRSH